MKPSLNEKRTHETTEQLESKYCSQRQFESAISRWISLVVVLIMAYFTGLSPCFAQPKGAGELANKIRLRDCTFLPKDTSVAWIQHGERWSYGETQNANPKFVVVDRNQDAIRTCHGFSQPLATASKASIFQEDRCHKESCPTLIVAGSGMLALPQSCSNALFATPIVTEKHGDWIHLVCRDENGAGYRQTESLIHLSTEPQEFLMTKTGEVAVLTPEEIKSLGCQPVAIGGIKVKSSEKSLSVETVALLEQLDEKKIVTRTHRWKWANGRFNAIGAFVDTSVSICGSR